ncbi:MAG: type II toxin-antitoxin system RelE/ParE family toxin [Nitrospirae bacterium]|nr:type II toxin-antitoxin system RelE/ParE family toxin [Nitrospirota bacterium]
MHLEWTIPSLNDLKDAGDFISQDSPKAAQRMAERVREAVENVAEYPNIGRQGEYWEQENLSSPAPLL